MKRQTRAALVVVLTGGVGLGSAIAGCGKDLPLCRIDDYAVQAEGDDLPNDCGTYQGGDPALDASAMTSAQSCVVAAAQGKQPFQMIYDQELRVNEMSDGGDKIVSERARVGWVGTIGGGSLAIEWYVQPIDDAGNLGEMSMRSCDGIVGGASCMAVAPADMGPPVDPMVARTTGGVTDACLVCVNPGPEQSVCHP